MSKSRQSHEAAKAFVSPLFAWSNAMLKGGELMLDSMATATRNGRKVRATGSKGRRAGRRR